jgi:hypothetical protein
MAAGRLLGPDERVEVARLRAGDEWTGRFWMSGALWRHAIRPLISIDGPPAAHDGARPFPSGRWTTSSATSTGGAPGCTPARPA